MKVIILAGGLGTRISEETDSKPKPMVGIAGKPMLWHIMSIFAKQGITEFLIATGYKGNVISEWVKTVSDPWDIRAIDTGLDTQTGGRIAECMKTIPGERVFATYGDGLGNVNLKSLSDFHEQQGKLATVTAVRPPARFGVLTSENGLVTQFGEKNQADSGWINGGFFLLEPGVLSFIHSNSEPFETGALPRLVHVKELMAYQHNGFWQPMDTLREKQELEVHAQSRTPPWLEGLESAKNEN
jgi:glucose-1-phosphate cytidylyltransferase